MNLKIKNKFVLYETNEILYYWSEDDVYNHVYEVFLPLNAWNTHIMCVHPDVSKHLEIYYKNLELSSIYELHYINWNRYYEV